MAHRGPDDAGTWFDADAEVGLGHRRLSILDLSPSGHQPMGSPDGKTWLVYNGEIYNYREHRERLAAKGYHFRSQSDTEVLLALYEERGLDLLQQINGMFAFALWDGARRRLVLARDHAGIKPLYYWQSGRQLYFASELKSLLKIPELPRELDRKSIADYLTLLWVPGRHTMLSQVKKLEPGHVLTWEDGKVEMRPWFELHYDPDEGPSEVEWIDRVHETFIDATRRQMVSDVPLGAFLSGGLDSSSIVACMRDAYPEREIRTYTIRVESGSMAQEQGIDDYPFAIRVAKALGVELKAVDLAPDVIRLLPKMVYHLDEPDADPAVFPSYLISKLAREDGTTVLLSGTGGDEVFFGYRSHLAYRQYERVGHLGSPLLHSGLALARPVARQLLGPQSRLSRRLERFSRGIAEHGVDRHISLADWSSPSVRAALLSPELARDANVRVGPACLQKYFDTFEGRGELNCHSHLLNQTFLAAHNFLYTDKSSMAVSLEARVPFMDVELMRLAAKIPERYKLKGGVTKFVLKRAMERHLPRELLYRPKAGFGAPLRQWLQGDLALFVREFLNPGRVAERGLFRPAYVEQIVAENESGRQDHAYLTYALVNLELWMQTFCDRPGVEVSW